MDATGIESALREYFAAEPGDVIAAYLYGSVARGTARNGSDVDVGVLLEKAPRRSTSARGRGGAMCVSLKCGRFP